MTRKPLFALVTTAALAAAGFYSTSASAAVFRHGGALRIHPQYLLRAGGAVWNPSGGMPVYHRIPCGKPGGICYLQ
jgi:hypothetical protein